MADFELVVAFGDRLPRVLAPVERSSLPNFNLAGSNARFRGLVGGGFGKWFRMNGNWGGDGVEDFFPGL